MILKYCITSFHRNSNLSGFEILIPLETKFSIKILFSNILMSVPFFKNLNYILIGPCQMSKDNVSDVSCFIYFSLISFYFEVVMIEWCILCVVR